ncbi:MAG: NusG domain II-containing protein [Clostridia bacterium]|nr:NusG domain II-containing protein [Clostridia bacterium]
MKTGRKKGDIWLVTAVLAVALCLFLLLWLLPGDGAAVEVTVDGAVYATLPLDTPTTLDIPGKNGCVGTLVIADGRATVTHATCPDRLCVRMGPVSRAGQSIVCLPGRIVVTVVGGTPAVDGEV